MLGKVLRALVRPFGCAMALRAWILRKRLLSIARRVDSFDAIGNMFLALNRLQSDASRTEHSPSGDQLLSAAELTALAFAERGPSRREPYGSATSSRYLGALHSLLPKSIHASVLAQFGRLAPLKTTSGSVPARITHAAISREVYLRLPRFMAKERETLEALFTTDISETLRDRIGFTPSTLFGLYDALHSYLPQAAADRIRAADVEFDEQLARPGPLRDAVQSHPGGFEAARAQILTAYTFSQLSALVSLSIEQIVERVGGDRDELERALERLSVDLDVPHPAAVRQFLRGDNLMRTRPFVVRTLPDGSRRWLLVQPTSLIFGMRPLFEEVLLAQPIDQAYSKARGVLLEQMGMQALVNLLRPDVALANVDYRGADRYFETDGLFVVGHVAVVVEAKSNRLTPYALAGAPERLWRELGPIISKAAEQAERLRTLLTDETTLHIRSSTDVLGAGQPTSRNWNLDVSGITEVFTIALTLEDLNFIATISSEGTDAGFGDR